MSHFVSLSKGQESLRRLPESGVQLALLERVASGSVASTSGVICGRGSTVVRNPALLTHPKGERIEILGRANIGFFQGKKELGVHLKILSLLCLLCFSIMLVVPECLFSQENLEPLWSVRTAYPKNAQVTQSPDGKAFVVHSKVMDFGLNQYFQSGALDTIRVFNSETGELMMQVAAPIAYPAYYIGDTLYVLWGEYRKRISNWYRPGDTLMVFFMRGYVRDSGERARLAFSRVFDAYYTRKGEQADVGGSMTYFGFRISSAYSGKTHDPVFGLDFWYYEHHQRLSPNRPVIEATVENKVAVLRYNPKTGGVETIDSSGVAGFNSIYKDTSSYLWISHKSDYKYSEVPMRANYLLPFRWKPTNLPEIQKAFLVDKSHYRVAPGGRYLYMTGGYRNLVDGKILAPFEPNELLNDAHYLKIQDSSVLVNSVLESNTLFRTLRSPSLISDVKPLDTTSFLTYDKGGTLCKYSLRQALPTLRRLYKIVPSRDTIFLNYPTSFRLYIGQFEPSLRYRWKIDGVESGSDTLMETQFVTPGKKEIKVEVLRNGDIDTTISIEIFARSPFAQTDGVLSWQRLLNRRIAAVASSERNEFVAAVENDGALISYWTKTSEIRRDTLKSKGLVTSKEAVQIVVTPRDTVYVVMRDRQISTRERIVEGIAEATIFFGQVANGVPLQVKSLQVKARGHQLEVSNNYWCNVSCVSSDFRYREDAGMFVASIGANFWLRELFENHLGQIFEDKNREWQFSQPTYFTSGLDSLRPVLPTITDIYSIVPGRSRYYFSVQPYVYSLDWIAGTSKVALLTNRGLCSKPEIDLVLRDATDTSFNLSVPESSTFLRSHPSGMYVQTLKNLWTSNGLQRIDTASIAGQFEFFPDGIHVVFIRDGDIVVYNTVTKTDVHVYRAEIPFTCYSISESWHLWAGNRDGYIAELRIPREKMSIPRDDGVGLATADTAMIVGKPVVLFNKGRAIHDGDRFEWTVKASGVQGTGRVFTTTFREPGWHTVTMTVIDSAGTRTSHPSTVYVRGVPMSSGEQDAAVPELSVWPNPASGFVHIESLAPSLRVYRVSGETVYDGPTVPELGLEPGVYIFEARALNGLRAHARVVVL